MEWAQPGAWGVITTLLAINWLEIKASEARQAKRNDELRAGNRSLGEKMDRMLDDLNAVPVMDCILPDDCCPNVGHGMAVQDHAVASDSWRSVCALAGEI